MLTVSLLNVSHILAHIQMLNAKLGRTFFRGRGRGGRAGVGSALLANIGCVGPCPAWRLERQAGRRPWSLETSASKLRISFLERSAKTF